MQLQSRRLQPRDCVSSKTLQAFTCREQRWQSASRDPISRSARDCDRPQHTGLRSKIQIRSLGRCFFTNRVKLPGNAGANHPSHVPNSMDRRSLYASLALGAGVAVCLLFFGRSPKAAADPGRVPTDPSEVLETLPVSLESGPHKEIKALRRALAARPDDLPRAVRLARLDIGLARERSDPRYLGHAQAALAPWWSTENAPVEVLVLRATIEQSLHDFESALRDLDAAVRRDPQHVQAWLTRA